MYSFSFFKNTLFLFCLTLLIACNPSQTSTDTDTATAEIDMSKYPDLFQKILKAHGGLDRWNEMNTLTYTNGEGAKAEYHTVDLKSRKSLIEVKNKFKLGSNGEKVWVTPHRDSFPGKSPRFVHNLLFYFVAIPYVLADPGVVYEDQGEVTVNDKKYLVLKTGFQDNVGDAPDDEYFLYADPTTFKVELLRYSVTYFDASRANSYNALGYEWGATDGLLFPTKTIGYKWADDTLGEKRYERTYSAFKYSKDKMPGEMFEVPEGAFTE